MRKTQPKFVAVERLWYDVPAGMKVFAPYGVVTLRSITRNDKGLLITPEQGDAWTQHPSQTITEARSNPLYQGA